MYDYGIDLTIAPELTACEYRMRPFCRTRNCQQALLSIDVQLKHVDLVYAANTVSKKTWVDHANGRVMICLPQDISGYHAKSLLLGERGISLLSLLAAEADVTNQSVCVNSLENYYGYLDELWSLLNDHLAAERTIPVKELLMKELRLKITTATGKALNRLESLKNHQGALYLFDADLNQIIDSTEALNEAIAYRVRKAAVLEINLEGLEERLEEIYEFCQGRLESISIDRQIDRASPGTRTYRTFSQAMGDARESFRIADEGGLILTADIDVRDDELLVETELGEPGAIDLIEAAGRDDHLVVQSHIVKPKNIRSRHHRKPRKPLQSFKSRAIGDLFDETNIGRQLASGKPKRSAVSSRTERPDEGARRVINLADYSRMRYDRSMFKFGHNKDYRQIRAG